MRSTRGSFKIDNNREQNGAASNLSSSHKSEVFHGAVVNGVINALVNGAIQWYLLRGQAPIPLTVDGITNDENTVLGVAVPAAVTLAMILTVISYLTLKTPKRRFLPDTLWLTVKHGIFAFGLIVSGAVVWQRLMGSVPVSLATAVIVLGVVAGIVAGMVNYMTKVGS